MEEILRISLALLSVILFRTLLSVGIRTAAFAVLSAVIVPAVPVAVPVAVEVSMVIAVAVLESAAARSAPALSLAAGGLRPGLPLGALRGSRVAFRNVNVRDALDRAEVGFLFGIHECDHVAVLACARGAADAVNVSFRNFGRS